VAGPNPSRRFVLRFQSLTDGQAFGCPRRFSSDGAAQNPKIDKRRSLRLFTTWPPHPDVVATPETTAVKGTPVVATTARWSSTVKHLFVSGLVGVACLVSGSAASTSGADESRSKARSTLTLEQLPLDRVFHGRFTVGNAGVSFSMPSNQGFVVRQIDIATNDLYFAVDGPAASSNPLAIRPLSTPGGYGDVRGTVTIDPPIVVPPGSVLNVGNPSNNNLDCGIRGYIVFAGEV